MEQRDILKDQIEQVGKVLAKVLANFLGLKSNGQISLGIEKANKQLKTEIDLDISKIASLSKDELKAYLEERKITPSYMETLAEYLSEIGEYEITNYKEKSTHYLKSAMDLLDLADEVSKSLSFERREKKLKIETLLNNYNEGQAI